MDAVVSGFPNAHKTEMKQKQKQKKNNNKADKPT